MTATSMHRQVITLAFAQAIFQTVSVLVMTVGALAGAQIASSPEWATVPIAAMFLGTAAGTFPASHWMSRVGRRNGFVLGAILGVAGGVIGALGIWLEMLSVLSLGTFLVGTYQSFAQFYRFAASEVADSVFRPRAIALVLGGGIVAAFLGPFLGRLGGPLLNPVFTGSFLIAALVSSIGAGALLTLRVSDAKVCASEPSNRRRLIEIVRQPAYLVALFSAATGYGIMILGMTATPIAMSRHQHELSATATVIQFHVLGMFLPSFFTGSLIQRFGVLRVMLTGIAILVGYVLMAGYGTEFVSFASALTLLGVGWNFLYVGGTTLLTSTYTAAEKDKAQATNDMTIFVVGLLCSFGAGWLHQLFGWQQLNLFLLPWLAVAALLILVFGAKQRRVGDSSLAVAENPNLPRPISAR